MLYQIIAETLSNEIKAGIYKEHERLPAELVLAEKYDTSKTTIRKALAMLVDKGIIINRKQSGYYVNPRSIAEAFKFLELSSLYESFPNSIIENEVLFFQDSLADEKIAEKLDIKYLDPVIFAIRSRKVDGITVQLENVYMPRRMFPEFTKEDYANSVYAYVEQKHKINFSIKTISTGFIPNIYEKYVPNLKGKPLLIIENTSTLNNGDIFEYSTNYHIERELKLVSYRNTDTF